MNTQSRPVPRRRSAVHRQARRGRRPEIEIMEPRVLLSKDPLGATRGRAHAPHPTHDVAGPDRIAIPLVSFPNHAAHARRARAGLADAIPGAPGQSVDVTFTLTARQAA